jgi:hypothetical protein
MAPAAVHAPASLKVNARLMLLVTPGNPAPMKTLDRWQSVQTTGTRMLDRLWK